MAKPKDYRDAITGRYMKKDKALEHPDNSVAETRKKRSPRKPKAPKIPVEPKPNIPPDDGNSKFPDFGENESPQARAFRMKMDIVFAGDIYTKDKKNEVPEESKNFLMNKDKEWSE